MRQWQGGAGLSRTFCPHFLVSLKTGSQLSREPPAALPEPHDVTRAGRSVFAGGLERSGAAVCVCARLHVSLVSGAAQRCVRACYRYSHVGLHISINAGSRHALVSALAASLGFVLAGVSAGGGS